MKSCPVLRLIRTALWNWRFGLYLAAGLLFFEYAVIGTLVASTPENHHWLGATISNTSDVAVYLNYLAQGRDHLLLENLFSDQPTVPRFDLFWSTGGLLVRAGLSPVAAHELLRVVMTIFLSFAIYATSRSVTNNEAYARLTSILMVSGMSTGWIYTIYYTLTHTWTSTSPTAPDLMSEFAIAFILLGGAHLILSFALQLLAMRYLWLGMLQRSKKMTLLAGLMILIQTLFHPYFIPLYGLMTLLGLGYQIFRHQKPTWLYALIINLALIPGAAYYLFLVVMDASLRKHHLEANILPMGSLFIWIMTLIPFFIAIYWMIRHRKQVRLYFDDKHAWLWMWVAAALICIVLPFPWSRKYTQGLLPVFVLLTLPFWLAIYQSIRKSIAGFPLKIASVLFLLFPFISLFQTQVFLTTNPSWAGYFFNPLPISHAWSFLRSASNISTVISTNIQVNLWTTVYASKEVWIAHAHETPDYYLRRDQYTDWLEMTDPDQFQSFLRDHQISHFMTLSESESAKYGSMLSSDWKPAFEEQGVTVWANQD